MRRINDLKIGIRLNILLSAAIVMVISSLGIYLYINQRNKIFENTDLQMAEQVNDLNNLIRLQIKERQNQIAILIETAVEIFNNG